MIIIFIIALCICLIILCSYPHYRQQRAFKKWSNTLNLSKHSKIYHRLYAHTDGFSLSKKARADHDAIEYIYGEIDFYGFIYLLSLVKPNSKTIFYDLGSGVGKATLACAIVFDVQKSIGIEYFENLHQCAETQRKTLLKLKSYHQKATRVQFIHGDFMTTDFQEATLIFINSTGFISPLWDDLSTRISQSNCQTVISISKPLKSNSFYITHSQPIRMSWGEATVYIEERRTHRSKYTYK